LQRFILQIKEEKVIIAIRIMGYLTED